MKDDYVAPEFDVDAFNCPHCAAYAHQEWSHIGKVSVSHQKSDPFAPPVIRLFPGGGLVKICFYVPVQM